MKKLMLALALTTLTSCEVIETGHRGIEVNYGKIQGKPLTEGFYFYNPISSTINEINIQENKLEGATTAFTKDTQSVTIAYALTWAADPEKVDDLFRVLGREESWVRKAIEPMTLGAIKDSIGSYIADDLVTKREAARDKVLGELKASLAGRNIIVSRIDFINLDFDDQYEKAVESKVVAIQKASEAKNKTVEIEEQAKQRIIAAEAEAKSMRIRSQALSENKSLVEYEAVQKWDGKLPQYMLGNSTPFINIK